MNYGDDLESLSPSASPQPTDYASELESIASQPQLSAPAKSAAPSQPPSWLERQLAKLPDSFAVDPSTVAKTVGTVLGSSTAGRAVMGAMDMGTGAVQLAAHATPGSDAASTDKKISAMESAYDAARGPDAGIDAVRIGGNLVAGVLAPGGKIAEGANLVNRLISAAKIGGTVGLLQPVSDAANYWLEKAKGGIAGIIGGVVGQPVAEVGAKVVGTAANKALGVVRKVFPAQQDSTVSAISNASPELQGAIAKARTSGADIDPQALARQVEADSLPVKMSLTEGQAKQDPILISNEMNMRGQNPAVVYKLRDQNQQLINNMNAIRANVAPDAAAPDHVVAGQNLIESVEQADAAKRAAVTSTYKALKDANGGQFPVDGQTFVANADNALSQEMKAPFLPAQVRQIMDGFKGSETTPPKPMTFENFENLRTILASEARKADRAGDGNAEAAIATVRNSLESLPMQGEAANVKPLADAARAAARDRFQQIDETPALKAVVSGNATADNFIQKYVVGGSKEGLANLALTLKDDPVALQTIKAGVVNYLKKSAGIVNDNGNFSQSGYNKALESVRPKLGVIFNPDEVKMLDTVGNVARYTQLQPRGSYVNNSNTDVAAVARGVAAHAVDTFTNTPVGSIVNRGVSSVLEKKANSARLGEILDVGAGASSPGTTQKLLTRTIPALAGQSGAIPLSAFFTQQAANRGDKRARNGQ